MSAVLQLFWTFLKIGLFSIGGGYAIIPLIREQVVANSGWISSKMFTDIITISQMTPGPRAVNTSTFVGLQVGGDRRGRCSDGRLRPLRHRHLPAAAPLFSKAPELDLRV